PRSPLFPYTTLFRSFRTRRGAAHARHLLPQLCEPGCPLPALAVDVRPELLERPLEARLVAQPLGPELRVHPVVGLLAVDLRRERSEEHTSELQSLAY